MKIKQVHIKLVAVFWTLRWKLHFQIGYRFKRYKRKLFPPPLINFDINLDDNGLAEKLLWCESNCKGKYKFVLAVRQPNRHRTEQHINVTFEEEDDMILYRLMYSS